MQFTPKRVLLVEDNPSDLELALLAFDRGGFGNPVDVVRDGAEALEFLLPSDGAKRNGRPRVVLLEILLDLKLPKIDGLEVLRRLRANPRTAIVPVVILTSSKEERDLVESYKLGVNAYVQKPVGFDAFRSIVKELGLFWLVINQTPPPQPFGA